MAKLYTSRFRIVGQDKYADPDGNLESVKTHYAANLGIKIAKDLQYEKEETTSLAEDNYRLSFLVMSVREWEELAAAFAEVIRLSDRKTDAWDRAKAALGATNSYT